MTPPAPQHLGSEISIGMSAYGNASITRQSLEALFQAAEGPFELILVDDCSPDNGETLELFRGTRALHPNTKLFSFQRNLEYTGSLNCILSHATGAFVLFLSNDVSVTPGYIREIFRAARSDPSFGIVDWPRRIPVQIAVPLSWGACPHSSEIAVTRVTQGYCSFRWRRSWP